MSDERLRALWRQVVTSDGMDAEIIERYLASLKRTQGRSPGEFVMGEPYVSAITNAVEWPQGGGITLTLAPLDCDGRPIPKGPQLRNGSQKIVEVRTGFPMDGRMFLDMTRAIFPECNDLAVDVGFDLEDLMNRLVRVVFERKTIANKFKRGTTVEIVAVRSIESLGSEEMKTWRDKRSALGFPLATSLRPDDRSQSAGR